MLCPKVQGYQEYKSGYGLVSDSSWKLLDLEKFEVERSKLENSDVYVVLTDKGHRVGGVWHRVRHLIEEHSQ